MKAARFSGEGLKTRFGFSERLAVRIGALESRGLRFSLAFLEEAAAREEVRARLLSPELLERSVSLDTSGARSLGPEASGWVVLIAEGERILGLDEERHAEEEWRSKGAGSLPAVPASSVLSRTSDPESRVRVTILAGTDPTAKVEALRLLALSSLSAEEKGALTLRCLADPDAEVRREAASALPALGMNRDLADALAGAATGTTRQRRLSLQKLASLAPSLSEAERRVAVSTLVAALDVERDRDALQGIVGALLPFHGVLGASPETVRALTRHLVRVMVEEFDALAAPVRGLFSGIAAVAGEEGAEAVSKEIDPIGDRRLRMFFLSLLCGMRLDGGHRRSLAERIAADLALPAVEDLETRALRTAATRLGDDFVEAVLSALPEAPPDRRAGLISLLDAAATSEPTRPEIRERAARFLLEELRRGDRAMRLLLLESRVWFDAGISSATRTEFARELIFHLHAVRTPRFQDLAAAAIRKLGPPAAGPLRECALTSPYEIERETAAQLLSDLSLRAESPEEHAEGVRFLRSLEGGGRLRPGLAERCVASACRSAKTDSVLAAEILADYRGRLAAFPSPGDLLVSLCDLASSPACDPGPAADLLLQVSEFLLQSLPDPEFRESRTEEGTLLEVGPQTAVYTDHVPGLLEGVVRIVSTGRIRPRILEEVLDRLLRRFDSVAHYREVWAPGNLALLAGAMEAVVRAPGTTLESRMRVLDALLPFSSNLSLASVFSRLADQEEETAPAYLGCVSSFVRALAGLLASPQRLELPEQQAALASLGRTLVNRRIAATEEESAAMKGRIVELMFERRVWETREGRELAVRLRQARHLPAPVRERLASLPSRRAS